MSSNNTRTTMNATPQHPQQRRRNKTATNPTAKGANRISKKIPNKPGGSSQNTNMNTNMNAELQQQQQQPEAQPQKKRTIYRRKKILRGWVLKSLFLIPLGVICLEYYIGKLIDLDDITDAIQEVYQEQLLDPWDILLRALNTSTDQELAPLSPSNLAHVSFTPKTFSCPAGQRRMINMHMPRSHEVGGNKRRIPMIIHQQSQTRCVTMKIDRSAIKWAFRMWSYYIHDEESRDRLFEQYCDNGEHRCEFPLLRNIAKNCFHGKSSTRRQLRYHSLRIELWKFLSLWIFGGLYVDLEFVPIKFDATTIKGRDDGYLLIDPETNMLSTKMMAVSPRHPIMYYAVQQLLLKLLMEESSLTPSITAGNTSTNSTTTATSSSSKTEHGMAQFSGSSVLSHAFRIFQQEGKDYKEEDKNTNTFSPGVYRGSLDRMVRVVEGTGLETAKSQYDDSSLVMSIFSSELEKNAEYEEMGMGMTLESDNGTNDIEDRSCLDEVYHRNSTK